MSNLSIAAITVATRAAIIITTAVITTIVGTDQSELQQVVR